jgi:hypothetical protein
MILVEIGKVLITEDSKRPAKLKAITVSEFPMAHAFVRIWRRPQGIPQTSQVHNFLRLFTLN